MATSPKLGRGPAVDVVSGQLQEPGSEKKLNERELAALDKHAALIRDLTGDGGEVMKHLVIALESRIQKLMSQDPYCQGLLTVLHNMNYTINVGKTIAQWEVARTIENETL